MFLFKNRRRLLLFCIDICIMLAAFFCISFIDLISHGARYGAWQYLAVFGIYALCLFAVRFIARCYNKVWRFANSLSFLTIVVSDAVGGAVFVVVNYFIPFSVLDTWMCISLTALTNTVTLASRFAYQIYYRFRHANESENKNIKIRVAIFGAGQVGHTLAEELIYSKSSKYQPVAFIDKDKTKIGANILELPVISQDGSGEKLKKMGAEEVFIAIPELDENRTAAIIDFYTKSGLKVKIYAFPIKDDGTSDANDKRVVREVRIEDLLFRDTLKVVDDDTKLYYKGKVIMVTGGGGSIGSELSRQIAKCEPKKLIIFDIYENNAYDIEQELRRTYGSALDLTVEIGSVRDRERLDAVFSAHRPEIVFHAAAHKHVPLMEHSCCEAIKNNVFGTYNTADMAEKYGVKKFILISTDKAVNPTNIMGASKRLCEMVVQSRTDSNTAFAAVRFGNVLGSNGSVIPLFKRQIESGGPVTITDKRIIRYFMTIPEASGLVMQAGAMAKCGELFVLDMGKPVKILDLAENMITLSGLHPYVDIDIVETGLRPGEKLYEELLIKTENLSKTSNNLIFIEKDSPLSREEVEIKLSDLRAAVEEAHSRSDADGVFKAMRNAVPTYRPPEEVNSNAQNSDEMKMAAATV